MLSPVIYQPTFEQTLKYGGSGMPWEVGCEGLRPLVSYLDPLATFTRASEASYYTGPPNTTGNFFAWVGNNLLREDKVDGSSGFYLFEGARLNKCLWSEDLKNVVWTKTLCTLAAGLVQNVDPDIDANVIQFQADAGASVFQLISDTVDNTPYATSCWVHKPSAGAVRISYLLRDGTTPVTADFAVGPTWTRIDDTRNWGTGATPPGFALQNAVAGTAQDIEASWFQVEGISTSQPLMPSTYARTGAAVYTRQADRLTFLASPVRMRTGKWRIDFAPGSTSAEWAASSGVGTLVSFATAQTDALELRPNPLLEMRINNVPQMSSANPVTWAGRHQVMRVEMDTNVAVMTLSGATTGNGAVAAGTVPAYSSDVHLAIGSADAGSLYFFGRIGEPYAA